MEKQQIFNMLTTLLKPCGFKKSGVTWYKNTGENLRVMVHLRKSRWGNYFYLDAGVGILSVISSLEMKQNSFNLDISIEQFVPNFDTAILVPALDLESSNQDLLDKLEQTLRDEFLPLLRKMETIDGIKELYANGYLKAAMIDKYMRELLGI